MTTAPPSAGRFRSVAIGAWIATVVVAAAAAVLVTLSLSSLTSTAWGFPGFGVLLAVTFGTVGLLINLRVPGNRIGWLFAAIGFASAMQEFVAGYVVYGGLVAPGSLPWVDAIAWLETWDWVPIAGGAVTFLLLLFPDGALLSERWRPVAWLSIGAIVLASIGLSLEPGPIDSAEYVDNPLGVTALSDVIGVIDGIAFVALILAVLLSAASMIVRFHRSRGVEREQLKWFASAAVFAGLVFVGLGALDSDDKAFQVLTVVALLAMPMSAGIAIMRYRLYDIDRIVSNTLAYAIISIVLFGVFALVNLVLQSGLSDFTNGDTLAVAVSTLLAAALFNPARSRVQRTVDRRFHRARYDGERTTAEFSERMRDQLDLDATRRALVATVLESVRPRSATVWIRAGGRTR